MEYPDDLPEKQEELENRLEEIARKYELDPDRLKKIVKMRVKGKSQREMSEKLGVSRRTVRKYENTLEDELDTNEFVEVMTIAALLLGGLFMLERVLDS